MVRWQNDVMITASQEEQGISRAIAQLCREFPTVSYTDVEAVVTQVRAGFERCSIRDFVPLFVERRARERLSVLVPATS